MTTRRNFLRQASVLGAGLAFNPLIIKAGMREVSANDKINV
ncbi:MAG: twin-arginine translocation signal domain-containing protein, partial [Tannerella sp.]|nr:twin-arginine translocation signal domain-containing protein [Tannerella sp.]MDR1814277.1 twin-arginine translocation signal domain-containing protein [Tannerella sp.]